MCATAGMVDKHCGRTQVRAIHPGGPDKGLRYCWRLQRSDPMNLIQFMLA